MLNQGHNLNVAGEILLVIRHDWNIKINFPKFVKDRSGTIHIGEWTTILSSAGVPNYVLLRQMYLNKTNPTFHNNTISQASEVNYFIKRSLKPTAVC